MNILKYNTCPLYFLLFLTRLIFPVILRYAEIKGGKKKNSTSSTMKKSGSLPVWKAAVDEKAPAGAGEQDTMYSYVYVCTYTSSKMARGWRPVILSHDDPCPSDGQVLGNYVPLNCWLLTGAIVDR